MPMPTAASAVDEDMDIVQVTPPLKEVKLEVRSSSPSSSGAEDKEVYSQEMWPSSRAVVDVKSTEQIKQEIQDTVQSTVKRVKEQSDRLQATAQPYVSSVQAYAERKPILFTFLVVFLALSAIPLSCFAFFVGGSVVFILGVAAIGICVTFLGTLLFASSVLLPVLLFTALLSTVILAMLVGLFLAHRLYLHVAASCQAGRVGEEDISEKATEAREAELSYDTVVRGLTSWAEETVGRVGISADRLHTLTNPSGMSGEPIGGTGVGTDPGIKSTNRTGAKRQIVRAQDTRDDQGKWVTREMTIPQVGKTRL